MVYFQLTNVFASCKLLAIDLVMSWPRTVNVKHSVSAHMCVKWQWWELDSDHDFLVSKNDLLRYGNHSLTYRIVERIFTQVRAVTEEPRSHAGQ